MPQLDFSIWLFNLFVSWGMFISIFFTISSMVKQGIFGLNTAVSSKGGNNWLWF